LSSTQNITAFGKGLSWLALAILFVLMIKGSYAMLFVVEVFQIVYFHIFIQGGLPYNYKSFLSSLSYLNFQFLPNIFKDRVVPAGFISSATPV
jgi:hypothetical protein